jgi:hypothetical protein
MKINLKQKSKTIESLLTPSNTKCFDCSSTSTSVNLTIGVFVCTNCAGLLRTFQHKLKSITASSFSQVELKELEEKGNERVGKFFDVGQVPKDKFGFERFMYKKYIDGSFGSVPVSSSTDTTVNGSSTVGLSSADIAPKPQDPEPIVNPYQMKFFGQYQNANLLLDQDSLFDFSDAVPFTPSINAPVKPTVTPSSTLLGSTAPVTQTQTEPIEEDEFGEFQAADPYESLRNLSSTPTIFTNTNPNDKYSVFKNVEVDVRSGSIWDSKVTESRVGAGLNELLVPVVNNLSLE